MKTLREYIDIVETLSLLEWAPTPEQTKWLGGANQQDPYIMNRMPGDKPPVTWFTDPADQALAKRMGFPATEPAAAVATPVAEPTKIEPTPLPAAPAAPTAVATPTPAVKPPTGQSGKPGAPNPVMTLQNKLIGLGAKITADGIMGPQTLAAMKEYGLDANGNPVKNPKTGQPVTNDKTANAIIQRGGVAPEEITKDMTVAQQARSDLEAQRANAHLKNATPGSLSARRNEIDAEYQAKNQEFLAKQAAAKAAREAASGQGPKTVPPAPTATPPVTGSVPPAPAGPPAAKTKWAQQYGGKYDPKTGAPLSESMSKSDKVLLDKMLTIAGLR